MADPQKPGVSTFFYRIREWIVIAIGLAAVAVAVVVANEWTLWILVPIPASIAVVYHVLNLASRFDNRKAIVDEYRVFTKRFDEVWNERDCPATVSEDLTDDMASHRPTIGSVLWGAALLTALFSVPAILSDGGAKLNPVYGELNTAVNQANVVAANAKSTTEQLKAAVKNIDEKIKAPKTGLQEWQLALVYSGFGVWLLIVMRMIGRINAGGLNARFLITASLRAGAAMMLGFFAGATTFFADKTIGGPAVYFLIGVFYPLFFERLRDEAFRLTQRKKSITLELPTTWIDGVDDDTQDILTEANVLSVQHLASADPGVLTVRTLFPFNRVLDLIDQAILITYFRENIVTMRKYGVRGVIDFVALVQPVVENEQGPERERSNRALSEIATALNISTDTLVTVGDSVFGDYRVNLLMRLWQHSLQFEGYRPVREEQKAPTAALVTPSVTEGVTAPMLSARDGAAATYRQADRAAWVRSDIEANLKLEALDRAIKFREENPDADKPAADWLESSFTEAYTTAQQKATIGLNPKPGAQAKKVYEEAFLSALGNV